MFINHTCNQKNSFVVKAVIIILNLNMLLISTLTAGSFFMQPTGAIIIDAGHGGDDPGAVSEISSDGIQTVYYEKDINLAIANRVAAILAEQFPEILIVKTRSDDSSISLWERAQYANTLEIAVGTSKIFISIHANTAPGINAFGFEVWKLYPYITHDFYSSEINESSILKFVDITNNSLNRELDKADSFLAESIQTALANGIGEDTRNRGIKESAFYVLKQTYMPSALIETGFMSFEDELVSLIDPAYQNLIATSIVEGINLYIEKTVN
ncbi:MAG: N-acetylmuramoyl-L-alanine amidase [Bacteroidetes bacterium]|nr:N-acetylmuramoyl-L-alanine amidase [Bacteroidota bacterium]